MIISYQNGLKRELEVLDKCNAGCVVELRLHRRLANRISCNKSHLFFTETTQPDHSQVVGKVYKPLLLLLYMEKTNQILKATCRHCGKVVASMHKGQLDYNLNAHEVWCAYRKETKKEAKQNDKRRKNKAIAGSK